MRTLTDLLPLGIGVAIIGIVTWFLLAELVHRTVAAGAPAVRARLGAPAVRLPEAGAGGRG